MERGEADWEVSSEYERIGGGRCTPGISVSVSVSLRMRMPGEEKGFSVEGAGGTAGRRWSLLHG